MTNYIYFAVVLCLSLSAEAARVSTLFGTGSGAAITFSGYAGPFTGALGGPKGAGDKCNTAYAGSHVCSYQEIMQLGTSYPYTYTIWALDSFQTLYVDTNGYPTVYSKSGYGVYNIGTAGCNQWVSGSTGVYGFTITTTGASSHSVCNVTTNYLACCK